MSDALKQMNDSLDAKLANSDKLEDALLGVFKETL
jgi:hypothetical protein